MYPYFVFRYRCKTWYRPQTAFILVTLQECLECQNMLEFETAQPTKNLTQRYQDMIRTAFSWVKHNKLSDVQSNWPIIYFNIFNASDSDFRILWITSCKRVGCGMEATCVANLVNKKCLIVWNVYFRFVNVVMGICFLDLALATHYLWSTQKKLRM